MTDDPLALLVAKQAVQDLVQLTAALLDREEFDGWLALFEEQLEYSLTAYSPELRREMTWWHSDRAALSKLLKEIPQHVRDAARHFHLVSPSRVEVHDEQARAVSPFVILRTIPNGETRLYVAGRYEDALVRKAGKWLYAKHRVIVETRQLETFTHVPL